MWHDVTGDATCMHGLWLDYENFFNKRQFRDISHCAVRPQNSTLRVNTVSSERDGRTPELAPESPATRLSRDSYTSYVLHPRATTQIYFLPTTIPSHTLIRYLYTYSGLHVLRVSRFTPPVVRICSHSVHDSVSWREASYSRCSWALGEQFAATSRGSFARQS